MPTKPDTARGSFAAVLASLRPNTDNEMAEELTKLVEAVKSTGKKGTLSVTFEVKPLDGGGGAVIIDCVRRHQLQPHPKRPNPDASVR